MVPRLIFLVLFLCVLYIYIYIYIYGTYILVLLDDKCPSGFKDLQGKCFMFSSDKKSYSAARAACQNIDSHYDLAIINNYDLNELVVHEAKKSHKHYRIGMDENLNKGTFLWINGSSPSFQNWASGEPNHVSHDSTLYGT